MPLISDAALELRNRPANLSAPNVYIAKDLSGAGAASIIGTTAVLLLLLLPRGGRGIFFSLGASGDTPPEEAWALEPVVHPISCKPTPMSTPSLRRRMPSANFRCISATLAVLSSSHEVRNYSLTFATLACTSSFRLCFLPHCSR